MTPLRPTIPNAVWRWLWAGLGFRAIVAWWLPAGFDEVYYYLYSRHLNWSYFDHPPVVAVTTGLGWWLTDTIAPITIRIGALGLYSFNLWLFYRVAKRLFDAETGGLAVAIASLSPLLWLTFGVLTSPDNGLILGWTLTLWVAAWEFFPLAGRAGLPLEHSAYRPSARIVLLGLTMGLACLSKYHGFLLGLGLVGFCLTSDRCRRALWSPWTALALLVFALTLTPLWFWNSQHDWVSFRFQLFLRFDGGEPTPYRPLGALGTWLLGIGYLFPTIGFPLWWQAARSTWGQAWGWLRPALGKVEGRLCDRTALILWVSLPIALGFTLLGGKQNIYPAWPAPGFWGLTLLLAHGASRWKPCWVRRWLWGTGGVVATLIMVALLHLSVGLLQRPSNYGLLGGLVPPAQDGSTALLDSGQLRSQVSNSPEVMAALQRADFVFTDEWYLSGYVDMALHPLTLLPLTCFSQDPRGFAFWFEPQRWVGQNALYFTLDSLHPSRAELVAEFQPFFASLEPLAAIPLRRGGTVTETVLIYRATAMGQAYRYPYPDLETS